MTLGSPGLPQGPYGQAEVLDGGRSVPYRDPHLPKRPHYHARDSLEWILSEMEGLLKHLAPQVLDGPIMMALLSNRHTLRDLFTRVLSSPTENPTCWTLQPLPHPSKIS